MGRKRFQQQQETNELAALKNTFFKTSSHGTFLVAQWLRLCASNEGGPGFDLWSGN